MTAADHSPQPEEGHEPVQEHAPAVERLETALGGDLTRFLLAALADAQAPPRGERR